MRCYPRLEWSWDFYGAPCRFCYCTYDPSGKENLRTLILACQKTHHIIVESWISWKKDYAAGALRFLNKSFELSFFWVEIRRMPLSKQVDHTWSYLIHFTQGALPICLSPMTRDTIRNHIQLILPATRRYAMLDRWPSTLSSLASMILEEVEVCFWYLSCPNLILLVRIFLLVF